MVCSAEERVDVLADMQEPAQRQPWSARRLQLLSIAAIACVTLVAAPLLLSAGQSGAEAVSLQQQAEASPAKNARFEALSSNLLGGLEAAMDSSVDDKVKAFMKAPAKSQQLMQLPSGGVPVRALVQSHRLLPFDPHPYVSQTQLDRLLAEKRELERKREAILRTLRMRRQAAAAKAAKDATEADRLRLQRAVEAAKARQLESAERAARAAAAKMREAAVAKQQAVHAADVAEKRQEQLQAMREEGQRRLEVQQRQDAAEDAADDMQYQQDKSVVDAKLQGYLTQERDLLRKIAAVEKVASHGGKWPEEGMPEREAQAEGEWPGDLEMSAARQPQLAQRSGHSGARGGGDARARSSMIQAIVGAVRRNDAKIAQDQAERRQLGEKQSALQAKISHLANTNSRLQREIREAQA